MAARFFSVLRKSPNNIRLLGQPPPYDSPMLSQFLRNFHSYVSRDFTYSRGLFSTPNFNIQDSGSAPLCLDNRIPTTVITGFRGSGKTTLLNHILTYQHGKRIAVIGNEFGEKDINESLVAKHSSVSLDIVTVNNYCLCCTVRGDLVKLLWELAKKKREQFDHIIIETKENLGRVQKTFCTDELVSFFVKLDGFITVVDSEHATKRLNEVTPRFMVNRAEEQVAYADRIILNKKDLVTGEELEKLTKRIKQINGMAQIKLAKFGSVDMDFVLGVGGYDLDRIDSQVNADSSSCASHQHETGKEHHKGHHHNHVHDSAVSSVTIVSEGTLDLDKFDDWLIRLIEEKGKDLYRMKGILSLNNSEQRYVFQGMHTTLDACPGKTWGPDEKRVNKLLFIGTCLDETALRKGFKGCLAS